jgi:hypothetical protein
VADMVIRDFYYIDTRVISSYFTQLPPKTRKRFRDEFVSTVDPVFKASLPPAVETERSKLEVPFDEAIAQLKYVEQHLKERGDIGPVDALNTRYMKASSTSRMDWCLLTTSGCLWHFPWKAMSLALSATQGLIRSLATYPCAGHTRPSCR